MPRIEVYTSGFCPYCFMAKRLLRDKQAEFTEVDVMAEPGRRQEMIQRAQGRTSVPQIFIDGRHIGGYDDMAALDSAGKLDPLLKGAA